MKSREFVLRDKVTQIHRALVEGISLLQASTFCFDHKSSTLSAGHICDLFSRILILFRIDLKHMLHSDRAMEGSSKDFAII